MANANQSFVVVGRDGKEIIFSRPYFNEEKELTFLYCSEFHKFPNTMFVLNENKQAIEIRHESLKGKQLFIMLKGKNNAFFQEAVKVKNEIKQEIIRFSKDLSSGKETILAFETGVKEYPYYFTTQTILDKGHLSCKFIAGFMYYINQIMKKKGINQSFDDYSQMQQALGKRLVKEGMDMFQFQYVGEEQVISAPLEQIVEQLVA